MYVVLGKVLMCKNCDVDEEHVTALNDGPKRKFAKSFVKRLKSIDKAMQEYKCSDGRNDDGVRRYVQCSQCFKKRPLLFGMDHEKIPIPFVCWMNKWNSRHSSCYIPEESAEWSKYFEDWEASTREADEGGETRRKRTRR